MYKGIKKMERKMKRFQKETQGNGSSSGYNLELKLKRFQKKESRRI